MARAATELRRQDIRDRLLNAGVETLLSKGYSQTSVDDIVRGAGVPKGSFYYYFASKEALVSDAVEQYAKLDEPMRDALVNGDGEPLDRLKSYFESYLNYFEAKSFTSGCLFGNLALEMTDTSPAVCAALERALNNWTQVISQVLSQAQSAKTLASGRDTHSMASFLLNAWEGALLRMRVEKSAAALRDFINITFGELLIA
jgi:TetR/AcrR family transcriptional regulator, transcriptional repressor for nem operon